MPHPPGNSPQYIRTKLVFSSTLAAMRLRLAFACASLLSVHLIASFHISPLPPCAPPVVPLNC